MIDRDGFKAWLSDNTGYSSSVICDQISRMKRADCIREWDGNETYLFFLEKESAFNGLSVSVRSQMRKAVRLYSAYESEIRNASKSSFGVM